MQRLVWNGRQQALTCFQTLSSVTCRAAARRTPLPPAALALTRQASTGRQAGATAAAVAQPDAQLDALFKSVSMLASTSDVYDGVNIDAEQLPSDPSEFATVLHNSILEWQRTQRKGVWLKLPISHAALVPVAAGQGFYFHHAEPDYVMMARWLPEDMEDKLPPNASHQVGVGAFVFDRQSQRVLMVQERNGPLRGKGVWKMPTGLATAREDIGDAAEREVAEETGVKASFRSVLAMRQAHTALFGKSDLFAVVALEPEAGSDRITIQEDELVAAEWHTLEQFENNPFPKQHPLLARIMERCVAYAKGEYSGLTAEKIPVPNGTREDLLMYGPSNAPASGL